MIPTKRWKLLNDDYNKSLLDVLLENRNLTPDHLEKFRLTERLHDPFLLPDMQQAIDRIEQALQKREKMGVYGDYDVDGIVSTTMMVKLFERLGVEVLPYLPHRERDGYGLRPAGVDRVLKDGVELLLTVDNGITSHEAVDYAREKGLDVIITDHHLQEGDLPRAVAVVNPNRKDATYPFRGLCGAGVVYKFVQALGSRHLPADDYRELMLGMLDLLSMATIADVVPVKDENFAFLKFGLKMIERSLRPGIVELKRVAGLLHKPITPISVGFLLAPRINAAGRLEDATLALKLLLSRTPEEAREYARKLDDLNQRRQKMQEEYINLAETKLEESNMLSNRVLIVDDDDWQAGLTGLVSGRLKERYSRPALVFARDESGNYVGSCRSIDSFHITEALTRFNEYFLNYGGHARAAGLTVPAENFIPFRDTFTVFANENITEDDMIADLVIDSVLSPKMLDTRLLELLHQVGPFGEENPEPVLLVEQATISAVQKLKNDMHLKLRVIFDQVEFDCLWWRHGEYEDEFETGMQVDLAFKPEINNWNGNSRVQLVVEDIRKSK
jgi:single-stranded-DNA-specific exonuclease